MKVIVQDVGVFVLRRKDTETDGAGRLGLEVELTVTVQHKGGQRISNRLESKLYGHDVESPGRLDRERLVRLARVAQRGRRWRRDVRRRFPRVERFGNDALAECGDGHASIGFVLDAPRRLCEQVRVVGGVNLACALDEEVSHRGEGALQSAIFR